VNDLIKSAGTVIRNKIHDNVSKAKFVVMSHEVLQRQFRGRRKEVEVDECFLTRRKYHKG